ncbi:magnesium chelatase [Candidatus Curtissbacteria bacterium RIFCSPLOWO2_01_FULL_39_62]|uniref:Magnesium chelatase n=2 Tax=Candidatus Curtissiibacteriota TaxID=1752717 RepID=A0A1F5GBR3_9BACT|nr:MAG: magnesium chelatase [Candidatus Curtissbacteria bacterium RIFCSPHIGHO2_01_FULL_39_57]OGD89289.1 MAG: magnesium chelatase [Candidatus Curtissbacteria bacterium RIFCSPHIGHO2_02_FULL_40_16b]OGD90934.1 MAG: magnesium chelatase [Candidatus Curtissbacteria bacterium RIFCSPHIGHO2_12_FULL_38_37]OGD99137.1 MAG: magnesium chelatase [Candidatus Curtissbacteria bacterium RIFCSPLOWO2_02_FULL_40_11]OGE02191.1 MAG: magnesium chelatase [Candidatus Curtissbacteria bacterium RIFCSPLOWO2_01_FULL_39_62]
MLAKVASAAVVGLDAIPITVEIDIASQGLPSLTIVGLPDKAVEESRERVRSALRNSGADLPPRRITVNLAPADLPKEGPAYDLPIALGILFASEQLRLQDISDSIFLGELSLDGSLRRIWGVLPCAIMARDKKFKNIFVPTDNLDEARIINKIKVYPVKNLRQLFDHFALADKKISPARSKKQQFKNIEDEDFDFANIRGQENAKRALEIAAAGAHNILMKGPPGAGKTLMARSLATILPKLSFEESLEVTKIYSVSNLLNPQTPIISHRPVRSPHHTTSHIGLIGGGNIPRPGEISLAHRGVLFLDEFPEFPRHVLEALRQPMEDGDITISRAAGSVKYPSRFTLIAAANPCPCGFFGDETRNCTCNPGSITRYQKRLSGPILDRIDIHVSVPAIPPGKLTGKYTSESSAIIQRRVQKARDIQIKRFKGLKITSNAEINNKQLKQFCNLDQQSILLLKQAISKLNLSARAFHRVIKIARTIADLENSEKIKSNHIAESLQYRPGDS